MATIRELKYFAGLDVGPAQQFTALPILERGQNTHDDLPDSESRSYVVRHLERWLLGATYTAIRDRLAELFAKPPLRHTQLVVDVIAVGRPVLDLLRRGKIAAQIKPLTITTGHRASHEDGGWLVPKKELEASCKSCCNPGGWPSLRRYQPSRSCCTKWRRVKPSR